MGHGPGLTPSSAEFDLHQDSPPPKISVANLRCVRKLVMHHYEAPSTTGAPIGTSGVAQLLL